MFTPNFRYKEGSSFYLLVAIGGLVSAIGVAAAYYMEHMGHIVTSMTNQIPWGLPHVFAIFLIVSASGVMMVASIGTLFGKNVYKPRARLACLLAISLLAAGLSVIMLDLGRADRLPIALTHINPSSEFGLNVIFYPTFLTLTAFYLWTLMEPRMNQYSQKADLANLIWRLMMTTGTGSIFGFIVARQAYGTAILAPMFIISSFAWGLAIFLIAQRVLYGWSNMVLHPAVLKRMKNLLGIYIGAVLYFVSVYHLTSHYYAKQGDFERFILIDGGVFPMLYWGGFVLLGTLLPLLLVFHPRIWPKPGAVTAAAVLVVFGALCHLYVLIVGAQAFPMEMFPGMTETSTFYDGAIEHYVPSLPEILLSIGGFGIVFTIAIIGARVLSVLPQDDIAQLEATGSLTN